MVSSSNVRGTSSATDISATAAATNRCCAPFDPSIWQQKEIVWHEKQFVTEEVRCVFYVPINMGAHVLRNQPLIEAAKAAPPQPLILSDNASLWRARLYIEVTGPVPGAQMATLSGTFLTRVYEGSYRKAGKWVADMKRYVIDQQRTLDKLYFGYTACPRCAKAYGKNYVVLLAKLDEQAQPRAAA